MPKALLIAPMPEGLVGKKSRKFHRSFPPLSQLLTATLLRADGWDVEVADMNADRAMTPEVVAERAHKADFVVYTTNPYADWQCPSFAIGTMLAFARTLPGDKLVITGNHGTHYPGGMIEETGAVGVARAEPEHTLLETAQRIRDGKPLEGIAGLSHRSPNGIVHNPKRTLVHMDEMPSPSYDLIDLSNYHYELLGSNFALLEASRGCPYSCNFCNLSMFDDGYRKRNSAKFLAELDDLVEVQGCRSLYIFDLEFTINKKIVKEVCAHLIAKDYKGRYGFRWACQTRADSVKPAILAMMKESGCELIHFGVEAGNEEILANTKKKIKKEKISEGIADTRTAGIKTAAFFIFGHEGETESHYGETLDFALSLNPTYASFHPMLPFPGSPTFSEKFGPGPYLDKPLDLNMTYFTPEQQEVAGKFVRKAYLRYYIRPRYVWELLTQGDWKLYFRQIKLFKEFLLQG